MANSLLTGVLLMTYGSATTANNVESYMRHIYGDRASAETIQDFENRYRLVGGSPLIEITARQAQSLQDELGDKYIVRSAMLHSEPFIDAVVGEISTQGVDCIVGVILSPQYSSFIMGGYKTALLEAATKAGIDEKVVTVAPPWPTDPQFVQLLAERVTESLYRLKPDYGDVPVVFTTHSLPERVVAKDPGYLEQLDSTRRAVLTTLGEPAPQNFFAYQSAGHTPEPWLKPDLVDVLAGLRTKGAKAVIIAPIQFLADHLEILYDLDIAARQQCAEYEIAYNRIELPNNSPLFISALKRIVLHARE